MSDKLLEQLRAMSDEELTKAADTLRKRADLQSALYMADLHVARYEPPSAAVDDALDRNLKMVREEIARRASQ